MIDTVHFRIEAKKYLGVYYQIMQYAKEKIYESKVEVTPQGGISVMEKKTGMFATPFTDEYGRFKDSSLERETKIKSDYLNVNIVDMENNKRLTYLKGFISVPSSNYDITFLHRENKNAIDINVSVPKYFFGTNVNQYLVSQQDYEFAAGYQNVNWQKSHMYQKFVNFFLDFNSRIFQNKVKIEDVEIRRIDFCYNLVFSIPEDLEYYYEKCKQIRMKHLRANSENRYSYDTSFHYVGKGYSFKIYKKGVEFEKNDLPELEKYNADKANEFRKFDIAGLKNLANRTLRFEMTMRTPYLSRKYREKVYRKDCPKWKNMLLSFYEDEKISEHNVKATRKDSPSDFVRMYKQYRKLTPEEKKIIQKAEYKGVNFFLKVPESVSLSNAYYDGEVLTDAKFSSYFMELLWDEFWKKIEDYKLESVEKVDMMGFGNEKENQLLQTIKKKTIGYSLDEIKQMGLIAESTYYKYKKFLKQKGFGVGLMAHSMPIDWTYERYFQDCISLGILRKRL